LFKIQRRIDKISEKVTSQCANCLELEMKFSFVMEQPPRLRLRRSHPSYPGGAIAHLRPTIRPSVLRKATAASSPPRSDWKFWLTAIPLWIVNENADLQTYVGGPFTTDPHVDEMIIFRSDVMNADFCCTDEWNHGVGWQDLGDGSKYSAIRSNFRNGSERIVRLSMKREWEGFVDSETQISPFDLELEVGATVDRPIWVLVCLVEVLPA
jgi:hypothetical protein